MGFNPNTVTSKVLENAVKLSNSNDFITSLPQGLDTIVGEGGINLSGGQRQRIGIAKIGRAHV